MKKIGLSLLILASSVYAGNYNKGTVQGCLIKVKNGFGGDSYVPLKNATLDNNAEYNMLVVGGYKIDNKNYKQVLKAYKRCNK